MIPKAAAPYRTPSSLGAVSAALADDSGQGLAEYGLILGFIALACIVAVVLLGNTIKTLLTRISTSI